MTTMATNYGTFGKQVQLLEAYADWRDEQLQEADSRADFATFLLGPISQSVYNGYTRVTPQYKRYASIVPVKDFRDHRVRGLNQLAGFGYVGDHGDYAEMTRTERPNARIAADTYGAKYGVTRQLIRNDDTRELLSRVPTDMGEQAGRFVSQLIISLIESNPLAPDGAPMFSVARGNQLTLALSEDSLVTAIAAMEDQRDDNGSPILATPTTLAVKGARLQLVAQRILRSQNSSSTTEASGSAVFDKGTDNPLANIMPLDGVVRDPFWNDNNDWYMFSDPARIPGFGLAFLDGHEQPFVGLKNPTVRNALGADMDPYEFDVDIIEYKVRLDCGAAPIDPRGVVRSIVA